MHLSNSDLAWLRLPAFMIIVVCLCSWLEYTNPANGHEEIKRGTYESNQMVDEDGALLRVYNNKTKQGVMLQTGFSADTGIYLTDGINGPHGKRASIKITAKGISVKDKLGDSYFISIDDLKKLGTKDPTDRNLPSVN